MATECGGGGGGGGGGECGAGEVQLQACLW